MKELEILPVCLVCGKSYEFSQDLQLCMCHNCNIMFHTKLNIQCETCFSPMMLGHKNVIASNSNSHIIISLCSNPKCPDYFVYSEKFLTYIAYKNMHKFYYSKCQFKEINSDYEYITDFLRRVINQSKISAKNQIVQYNTSRIK